MANIPGRQKNVIYDYSAYNFAANIQAEGERRYFDTVFSNTQNLLSVMGDGVNQADDLPFLEPIIIHATGNVNLNDLRLTGNRILLYNTTAATITVNIGTTGIPNNVQLIAYNMLQLYFNGTNWKIVDTFVFHATGNLNLEGLRIIGTKVIVYNTTAATITVNLNTAASPDNINLTAYNMLFVYFDGSEWRNIGGHIHNDEYIGKAYMLDESDRPNAWVLNGGNQVSPNWTDVDFSAYVPTGQYLKGLILLGLLDFNGDNVQDIQYALMRQNGSAETDIVRTRVIINGHSNLAAGISLKMSSVFSVLCDTSGIVEYIVSDTQADLSLTILGYYLESRL